MTFGNDKLTNLFPPLITLQRKIPKKKSKIFKQKSQQEILLKISCFSHLAWVNETRGSNRA